MFGFQADFAWEGLVNQWLSRMQYCHPADVFWNITVWSTMENSSVPATAFWRMIACAHGATASVSFFRKGAVGSHGLYLVNTTAAHRAPQNVPLHRVWSQSWMHFLVKGHSSASCHSLATSGSHKYLQAANVSMEESQVWSSRHENCFQSYLCPRVFHV